MVVIVVMIYLIWRWNKGERYTDFSVELGWSLILELVVVLATQGFHALGTIVSVLLVLA